MRRILLSLPFLMLLLAPVANADRDDDADSATNAVGVDRRCEAKMDRAAGRYARCLLKAKAHAARDQEQDVEETREAEAECREDFDGAVADAQARHQEENCTPFVTQMEQRTASYAEAMALEAAGVPALELLVVQSADGGELTESTLTLSGVSDQTGWFSDRPFRFAGQITTEEFISLWDEGDDFFAADPPNANFTCEADGEVVNRVVTLRNPVRIHVGEDTWNLRYTAHPTEEGTATPSVSCDGPAHLFLDDFAAISPPPAGSLGFFVDPLSGTSINPLCIDAIRQLAEFLNSSPNNPLIDSGINLRAEFRIMNQARRNANDGLGRIEIPVDALCQGVP